MAHLILGDRFMARSKPAWHNIARRIFTEDEKIGTRDAMLEIASDINVVSAPLFYEVDGLRRESDKVMILRKPTADSPKYADLGIATDSWALDSYPDLAGSLEDLPRNGYAVETVGILQEGGLAFMCFRGADYAVRGDEMRDYFTANLSLTPGVGRFVLKSDVRTVCWNTNLMAQGMATINLGIPHSADAKQRIALAAKLVAQFAELKEKGKAIFEAFADKQVTQKDVDTIIYAAFQLPKLPAKLRLIKQQLSETEAETFRRALTPNMLRDLEKEQERYDTQCENVLRLREKALERFEAFDPPDLRGTAWACYNAVTELADWREGRNADENALLGARAREKGRAFEAAMALVAR